MLLLHPLHAGASRVDINDPALRGTVLLRENRGFQQVLQRISVRAAHQRGGEHHALPRRP
jgi:hypothetical protein